jgi:hypothetical protein
MKVAAAWAHREFAYPFNLAFRFGVPSTNGE